MTTAQSTPDKAKVTPITDYVASFVVATKSSDIPKDVAHFAAAAIE